MDEQDEIIVFKRFESAIEANLAKTKLDAYEIPCFLTQENVANLFPMQSFQAMGVRLHLFAADADRATTILAENNLYLNGTE